MGPDRRHARRFLELLATAALAGALVLALAPARSEAVGGGLSLADRLALSGTPMSWQSIGCNQDPVYVVPEGRRLAIVDMSVWERDNNQPLVEMRMGRFVLGWQWGLHDNLERD